MTATARPQPDSEAARSASPMRTYLPVCVCHPQNFIFLQHSVDRERGMCWANLTFGSSCFFTSRRYSGALNAWTPCAVRKLANSSLNLTFPILFLF